MPGKHEAESGEKKANGHGIKNVTRAAPYKARTSQRTSSTATESPKKSGQSSKNAQVQTNQPDGVVRGNLNEQQLERMEAQFFKNFNRETAEYKLVPLKIVVPHISIEELLKYAGQDNVEIRISS